MLKGKNLLVESYTIIRNRTVELCKPLNTEDYVPQPALFVSPPKWHLAHTTWFFEEMILSKFNTSYTRFNKDFSFLFNSYYNTVGERTFRGDRGSITRPGVEEVYQYRAYVDKAMRAFLSAENLDANILYLIELGLNHEQQHQELLITDLKFTLSLNPTCPVYESESNDVNEVEQETGFLAIEEGVYEIGHKGKNFAFDNESQRHKVFLHAFELSKQLVTNGEYMAFLEDDGYNRFAFWLDEGWSWVKENKVNSPLYWQKTDGEWHHFTLAGLKKVNPDAVLCHINYYEASAFAAWKGMRLPTEFEWEVASSQLNWGKRWEWTNSAYLQYPGFKTAKGAVGEYNGKFMINQMVLRGASSATAKGHSRHTYRNFFHPHYQWQYAGIRLAKA
jgi:ergothioneine biosynthesis protein EgtB